MIILTEDNVITLQEGSGDNLSQEDIDNGCVDYFMSSVYEQQGDELVLVDAGQILTKTPISEMEEDEIVETVFGFWDGCERQNYTLVR